MTIRIAAELRGSWSTFWATTFTFEVSTFENFVLPRLAGGSLAATVLADQNRLAKEWERVSGEGHAVRANRDYLVRGIDIGGSFHPKTLLLATSERARLLVGSGNLTLRGLDTGEVFTRFETGTPEGNAALAAWRTWMQGVVDRSEDLHLQRRWRHAATGLPDVGVASSVPPFVSNERLSILDILMERLRARPVDELHLAAPFWDEDCSAFTTLLDQIRPKRVALYLHDGTSVSGEQLRAAIENSSAEILVKGWGEYVHAKLIGIVSGSEGLLLSGSPNLSDAALTLPAERPGANAEAATIARGTEEEVRTFFQPPGIAEMELELDELERFRLEPPSDGVGFPIRLVSAVQQGDGRIRVGAKGLVPPSSHLSNGVASVPMGDDSRTSLPLDIDERRFVRIVSDQGDELSNAVPVDLPGHLEAFAHSARDTSRPTGFEQRDMDSPVGWLLGWLHGECVFDVDEAVPRQGSESADEEEVGTSADDDFWDRLQRDDLRGDPRLARYTRGGTGPAPLEDEVFLFLEMMLHQAPETQLLRLIRGGGSSAEPEDKTPGAKWSPAARLRVRLYNVLARWIRSLGDPRLLWLDPIAPLRNFSALAGALLYCWLHDYLQEKRLARLTRMLLAEAVGSDQSVGFLDSLDDETLERANEHLDQAVRDTVSTLVFVALRSDRQVDVRAVFEWQPTLWNARRLQLVAPSHVSAAVCSSLAGSPVTREVILDELERAASYEDDEHWCERMSRELDLDTLQLKARSHLAEGYGAHLIVSTGVDLLGDPRIARLARHAIRYREASGVMIESGSNRLSVKLGGLVAIRHNNAVQRVIDPLDEELLDLLLEIGAGFVDLLPARRSA